MLTQTGITLTEARRKASGLIAGLVYLTGCLIIRYPDDMDNVPELAERVRLVLRILKRRAQSASGPDAPTPTETSVLGWLDEKGAMTPSALSAAQNVRPQTMGQALDLLAGRDWVRRGPHPTDRRQILVSLTPAGRKALAKGRRLRQAWLVAELAKLPARDRRAIASALTVFERFLQPPSSP
jgi:DNA-binding MarR family transcriptional regulator